ncbi:MAG: T9SS type A sorting domain-containing protein [Ignavibacteria bacterium]|nr:T9SS type A sorting domain-containing protein [Ignavibacteria bacterium]MBK9333002.1 T9SS type A sorting domain-containing protein [Ignavibacteria bacterium]
MKFNINGNILSSRSYFASHDYGTLVMGDINQSGNIEFATGTQQHLSNLSVFNSNLERFSGWPQPGGGEHYATVVIGKLAFGNFLNIISNSWDAKPIGFGKIYAYNLSGEQLSWSPLRPWGIVKAISLADLNNDGSVELISVTSQTNAEFNLNIWTFPGIPFTHENFPWPQYGHDRYRTNQHGFIPPDEPVGIQPMNTNVPASFNLYQNFPNPFNPATSIKFDIAKKGKVSLVVFDILGRELSTLINESLNPGTYQVSFDGSGLSSGIYFCRLQSGDYSTTTKMNLIK